MYTTTNPQQMLIAAEPIVRFVSKKMAYDDDGALTELERATAKRAVEVAAWSVCVMPETADILNDSPDVRSEMLKLLDLERDDFDIVQSASDLMEARAKFANSIVQNKRLYTALVTLAPDLAQRISYLAS